jgi:hypothetical protein
MTNDLLKRARRHGTQSIFAGDEPQRHELTEHWQARPCRPLPKGSPWRASHSPRIIRFVSKREAKRRRNEKLSKRAAEKAFQARAAVPWPIVRKGEH